MTTDTLGRIVTRVPAATSSGSNLFRAKRALTSLAGHLVTSDLNHLGEEYARRVLSTHPGWLGYWAASPGYPTSAGPELADIDWEGARFGAAGRTANACLGTFWVVPTGAGGALPKLVLRGRARAAVTAGSTAGVYLGVAPGRGRFPTATSSHKSVHLTSSSFVDLAMVVTLGPADLEPWVTTPSTGHTTSGAPAVGDAVRLMCFSAWVGAYNSTNKNTTNDVADLLGLTLSLEP